MAVVVLFGGLWYYRKWLLRGGKSESDSSGVWTFDDLRRMKQEGKITEEEYQALRATLVAAYRGEAEPKKTEDTTYQTVWELSDDQSDKNGPDFDLRNGPSG